MRTKFLRKNTYNSLLLRRYRTWKNTGRVKFWQIVVDEANGEEYFIGSDQMTHCIYEHWPGNFGKLCIIHQIPKNFLHPIFSHAR